VGQVPAGYKGEFGPIIKAHTLILKNLGNMSESKILDYLRHLNIKISAGTISNILIKNKDQFHQEKAEIIETGLASTRHQQIDDTAARVNGENWHTHVLGNPFYTAYVTTPQKNRLTVLEILNGGQELTFCLNDHAFELLARLRVAKKHINELSRFRSSQILQKEEMEALINHHLPPLSDIVKNHIWEAAAIASYQLRTDWPVVKILLADDAPQFKLLTEELASCWVHDGRHYKKLEPVVPYNAQLLAEFRTDYWDFYGQLLDYKSDPRPESAQLLSARFDQLFSTQTGYEQLDDRIAKSHQKKELLLLVLKYPDLPLHNNDMELGARAQTRKRDVSLHTITNEGTKANDTFLTIVQTSKKLGVNAFDYIHDRISQKLLMPSLAELIRSKTTQNACI